MTMSTQEEEETNSQLANSIRKQEQVQEDDNNCDVLKKRILMAFLKMTLSESLMHCHTNSIQMEEEDHNNIDLLEKCDRGDKDIVFL